MRSGVTIRDHLVAIFPGVVLLCPKAQPRHLTRAEFARRLVENAARVPTGVQPYIPIEHRRQEHR